MLSRVVAYYTIWYPSPDDVHHCQGIFLHKKTTYETYL
ncbi:hypothetical protein M23134_06870 [Microscilla marina ATCC 23134]|uniref:Uncharacterized protein n=1 Tax=Microscilla marina ATCC 23134 TaxID=313606 RepID=A1ZQ60_MICM2|nr:hypothetical protein M23134_06870 [Microscilla marina ATCC 23134]